MADPSFGSWECGIIDDGALGDSLVVGRTGGVVEESDARFLVVDQTGFEPLRGKNATKGEFNGIAEFLAESNHLVAKRGEVDGVGEGKIVVGGLFSGRHHLEACDT